MHDRMTVVEVATEFGVSRQKVYAYITHGIALGDGRRRRLPTTYRPKDKQIMIDREDVRQYKHFLNSSLAKGAAVHRRFRGVQPHDRA